MLLDSPERGSACDRDPASSAEGLAVAEDIHRELGCVVAVAAAALEDTVRSVDCTYWVVIERTPDPWAAVVVVADCTVRGETLAIPCYSPEGVLRMVPPKVLMEDLRVVLEKHAAEVGKRMSERSEAHFERRSAAPPLEEAPLSLAVVHSAENRLVAVEELRYGCSRRMDSGSAGALEQVLVGATDPAEYPSEANPRCCDFVRMGSDLE